MWPNASAYRRGCWSAGTLMCMLCCISGAAVREAEPKPMHSLPFFYDAKNRRDPFVALVRDGRPVALSQQSIGEFTKPVLYGILWDAGGQSIALINERETKVGETVNGYRVKEIRQDAVVLEGEGGPVVLRIAFDASSPSPAHNTATRAAKGGAKP